MKDLNFKHLEKLQSCMTANEYERLQRLLLACPDDVNSNFTNWIMNNRANLIKPMQKIILKEVAFEIIKWANFFIELTHIKPLKEKENAYFREEEFYNNNFDTDKIFIDGNKEIEMYTNDSYKSYAYGDMDKIFKENLNFNYVNQTIDMILRRNGFKKYSVKGYLFPLWMLNQETFVIFKKGSKFDYSHFCEARDFLSRNLCEKAEEWDNCIIYIREMTDEERNNFFLHGQQRSAAQEDEDEDEDWNEYVGDDYYEDEDEQD